MTSRSFGGAVARRSSDESSPLWGAPVAAVAVAVLVAVYGLWFWSETYHSAPEEAKRQLDWWVGRERGCLLSRDRAHVDPASGLVVAEASGWIACGGEFRVEQAPWVGHHAAEFIDGWNAEARRRLAAGETVGPRFLDRATTVGAVRDRFRRDGASAVALPDGEDVVFGDHEAHWWWTSVIVRRRGEQRWLQPAGGAPPDALHGDDVVVTALTADGGRTLWARATTKAGAELRYFIVDLETGTNFEIFDAPAR